MRLLLALLIAACTLVISQQYWFFGTVTPFAMPLLGTLLAAVTLGYGGAVIVLVISGLGAAYLGWPELREHSLLEPFVVVSGVQFLMAAGLVLLLSGRERRERRLLNRVADELSWLQASWPSQDAVIWRLDPESLRFVEVRPLRKSSEFAQAFGYPLDHWLLQEGFLERHLRPRDRAHTLNVLKRASRMPGQTFAVSHNLVTPSGEEIPLLTVVRAEEGGLIHGTSSSEPVEWIGPSLVA